MPEDPVCAAFSRLSAQRPSAPLLASASRSCTVGDVDALSQSLSARLERSGLTRGDVVALCSPNGLGFMAGFLALRRRGLVVLLLGAGSSPEEQERVALGLGARAALSCGAVWPNEQDAFVFSPLAPEHPASLPRAAVLKLTSGSTGEPRGVVVSPEALHADDTGLTRSMGLRAEDRIIGAIPMSHSYGLASVLLPALVRGSLVAVPDHAGPFATLAAANAADATLLPTVPAHIHALLRMSSPALPSSLRLVVSAGAPLGAHAAKRFRERFGHAVHAFYGSSETGGICYDVDGGGAERGTVGVPVSGVNLSLQPLEPGDSNRGVVVVHSPAVACSYHPRLDSKLQSGRFETSDLACWDGCELRLLGRTDALINVKGRKVNPAEVERVVACIAGVDEVVALGVRDELRGSDVIRVVVACAEGTTSAEDVVALCRHRLEPHKVPRSVILVQQLPRTPNGKLDRAGLLSHLAQRERTP